MTREGQNRLVRDVNDITAKISGNLTVSGRTRLLLSEAAEGGWEIAGTAYGKQEFADLATEAAAARAK